MRCCLVIAVTSLSLASSQFPDYSPICSKDGFTVYDSEIVLEAVNGERENLRKGTRQNGPNGDNLPAAWDMKTLKWNCELEQLARNAVKGCPESIQEIDSAKRPQGKAEIFTYYKDTSDTSMAPPLMNNIHALISRDSITREGFKEISENGIKYNDETNLANYANLVRASTTEIGCAEGDCSGLTDALYCVTNQPPLAAGDYVSGQACILPAKDKADILSTIERYRGKLENGTQQNGPNGDTLPAALEMQTLNWSCELEKQARIALNDQCPNGDDVADFANAVKDKAGIFQTKNVDTDNEETNSITEVLESFLNSINNESLTDISAGIKYSGEMNLRGYADLVRANTTEIACAKTICNDSDSSDNVYSVYCITNTAPLKNGELIYETLGTTTTNSTMTTTTNSAITTTTNSTITMTTTMTTTTTKKPKLSTTPCPTASTMRKVPRTTTPCPTLPRSARARRKAREVFNLIKEKALFPEAELEDKEICPDSFMTDRLRIRFLEMHNYRRALVALGKISFKGKSLPQAQNMQKLRYDCKLEEVAAHYASQCPERSFRGSSIKEIGENFLRIEDSVGDFEEAVNATVSIWWAGARRFGAIDPSMLLKSRNFGPRILSFTQMAWATTRYIGCSIVKCSSSYVSVCRYQPRGNVIKELVYKPGNTCTDCATGSKCIEELGLCD